VSPFGDTMGFVDDKSSQKILCVEVIENVKKLLTSA